MTESDAVEILQIGKEFNIIRLGPDQSELEVEDDTLGFKVI